MISPIFWHEDTITWSVNGNVPYMSVIAESFSLWGNYVNLNFVQVGAGQPSDFIAVDLDELLGAFNIDGNPLGYSVTVTDGNEGVVSYFAMHESSLRIAMHEIGHGFGFVDDPAALDTLYSYDVHYDLPQARDIEEIQSVFGPSPRDDVIHGGMWGGTIYEGVGDGLVYGNQGDDVLYGNQGWDTLYGGQGDDILYGGQDDDLLIGGIGADTLIGGAGNDTFVYNPTYDTIVDFDPLRDHLVVMDL